MIQAFLEPIFTVLKVSDDEQSSKTLTRINLGKLINTTSTQSEKTLIKKIETIKTQLSFTIRVSLDQSV